MNYTLFMAIFALMIVSAVTSQSDNNTRNRIDELRIQNLSGQLINYSNALNDLYANGTPADGDATTRLVLPQWLARNPDIRATIQGGAGFVYMPTSPGLFTQVELETEKSAHFGISDGSGMNTTAGRVNLPAFIPPGYVVYAR
ncbi:type IV pilus biogenesis protein PilM [Pantoea ananatis]|uniref:type IV pilus biogenesis protein PilM n=2 Tax=Pantoea ananas TaxID=553 RepID=UPI0021E93164|nr:type IV pilus biogenesis protein PilM [Pantoea ananatis]MCW0309931.1 hypothetical protein [Pantoea ananatis]MCW0341655.1 hypothetical protein [Pantoea ananatis]MCW0360087.1 hypothetical protein [Pantoea ananatis]MCW0364750.1 hypothetical protein [Pantoea ananatis]UYK95547.1 type IV pilus biogenesis protein PilM [Pantoea ananatis]